MLLGMGGSSPRRRGAAAASAVDPPTGSPRLHVLDSTHPEQIAAALRGIDPPRRSVVVASKSGSTLEPNLLFAFFFEPRRRGSGADRKGRRGASSAITDPGLGARAGGARKGFSGARSGRADDRGTLLGALAVRARAGGAARLRPRRFAEARRPDGRRLPRARRSRANPGVALGLALAVAPRSGRDKLLL